MLQKINTLKTDLHNVFVEGNANNIQLARVFTVLALPLMCILVIGLHAVRY